MVGNQRVFLLIPAGSVARHASFLAIRVENPAVPIALFNEGLRLALDCEIVGSVADGGAVLEAAQRLLPDVIVVDLNLPNVSGLEVCLQITRLNPAAKVIVFTAMNDPDIEQRYFEVGASAFVFKGAGNDLLATVKRLATWSSA